MSTSWNLSRLALSWLAPTAMALLLLPAVSFAQVDVEVSANVAPPELPVYDQPPIPGDGFVWTPGYWAWSDDYQDYFWVPGTWVQAPQPEYLWTPGYWAVAGAVFLWHAGYWGPHVGFYGGVNYGYGYGGNGYEGGYWQGGHLYYNRSVNNINNVNITNVYNKTVINNVTVNRVSYNGGNGVHAQATPAQMAAANEHHITATQAQQQHVQLARGQENMRASQNQGHPPIAATPRPAAFNGAGVVGAKQGRHDERGPCQSIGAAACPRAASVAGATARSGASGLMPQPRRILPSRRARLCVKSESVSRHRRRGRPRRRQPRRFTPSHRVRRRPRSIRNPNNRTRRKQHESHEHR